MANYDFTTTAAQTASGYRTYTQNLDTLVRKRVFSLAELTTLKGSTLAATDTFDLLPILPGELVTGTSIRTIVADNGTSTTVALGDQSAASYQAATSVTATAGTVVGGSGAYLQNGSSPYNVTGGKFYTAANILRATLGGTFNAAPTGVFEVMMTVVPTTQSATY
jgi:hypothetical protein